MLNVNMNKLNKNEKGFSPLAIIFAIVVFGLIATLGWAVYYKNHQPSSVNSRNATCPPGRVPEYSSTPGDNNYICIQPGHVIYDKPVIYLYPIHPEQVDVKLSLPVGFSKTVPNYDSSTGWQVLAQPDGTLTSLTDGRAYPYLFWESKPAPAMFNMTKGFVVAGSQTRAFLQSQLTAMGLNQNETNAFITFWLPKMQGNRYNLIHFAGSEYTNYAKLTVTPTPDSLLRVFMVFEPLRTPVQVSPQSFPPFHRVGFTVVEWGGTSLN